MLATLFCRRMRSVRKNWLRELKRRMGSKPSKPMPWVVATNTNRLADGQKFLSMVWRTAAGKVIEEAVRVYGLSPEQARALRAAFGRVQYIVEAA